MGNQHPRPAMRPTVLLVPVLAVDDEVTPELDHVLTTVARAARAGDAAARNALHTALAAKIDRFVDRCRLPRPVGTDPDPWGIWEPDDLAQEAFLVFADLIAAWPGEDGFVPYLLRYFPWRLRDAARRLVGRPGVRPSATSAGLDALTDGSAGAAEALALLEAVAAALPPPERDILLWRIRDREPMTTIARRLGVDRRSVARRWQALLVELRHSLEAAPPK